MDATTPWFPWAPGASLTPTWVMQGETTGTILKESLECWARQCQGPCTGLDVQKQPLKSHSSGFDIPLGVWNQNFILQGLSPRALLELRCPGVTQRQPGEAPRQQPCSGGAPQSTGAAPGQAGVGCWLWTRAARLRQPGVRSQSSGGSAQLPVQITGQEGTVRSTNVSKVWYIPWGCWLNLGIMQVSIYSVTSCLNYQLPSHPSRAIYSLQIQPSTAYLITAQDVHQKTSLGIGGKKWIKLKEAEKKNH